MYHDFNYEATLASSLRAQWQLDDVFREDQDLDFTRNFMPESLARSAELTSLNPFEQRILNQISAALATMGVTHAIIAAGHAARPVPVQSSYYMTVLHRISRLFSILSKKSGQSSARRGVRHDGTRAPGVARQRQPGGPKD